MSKRICLGCGGFFGKSNNGKRDFAAFFDRSCRTRVAGSPRADASGLNLPPYCESSRRPGLRVLSIASANAARVFSCFYPLSNEKGWVSPPIVPRLLFPRHFPYKHQAIPLDPVRYGDCPDCTLLPRTGCRALLPSPGSRIAPTRYAADPRILRTNFSKRCYRLHLNSFQFFLFVIGSELQRCEYSTRSLYMSSIF